MQFLLNRLFGLGFGVIVFLTGLGAYNSYKYLCWPQVQAVVASIERVCVHTKRTGRYSVSQRRPACTDESEATKLVADGYKHKWDEAVIRATYEVEPGKETYAILRPRWESADTLRPGSIIQIRYSPGSPSEGELATRADVIPVVILGFLLGALLLACLLAAITFEGGKRAKIRA